MEIDAIETDNSIIFSMESTKLKQYRSVNKGRKLTYDDKHSMKGAIKVREYL